MLVKLRDEKLMWMEKRLVFFEGKEASATRPTERSVSQETLKKNFELINLLVKTADNLTSIEERDAIRDRIARIARDSRDLQDLTKEDKAQIEQTENQAIEKLESLIRSEIEKKVREKKYLAEKMAQKIKDWINEGVDKTKDQIIAGYEAIYREVAMTIEGFQLVINDLTQYGVRSGTKLVYQSIEVANKTYNDLIEVKRQLEKKKEEVTQWAKDKQEDALKKIAELEKKVDEGIEGVKASFESAKKIATEKYSQAKENLAKAEEFLKNCPEKFKAEAMRLRNKAYDAYIDAKRAVDAAINQGIVFVEDVAEKAGKIAEKVGNEVKDAVDKSIAVMTRGVKIGIGIAVLTAEAGFSDARDAINWGEEQLILAYREAESLAGEAKQKALQQIEQLKTVINQGKEKLKNVASKMNNFVKEEIEKAKKIYKDSVEAYKKAKGEAKKFMLEKMNQAYETLQSLLKSGAKIAIDVYNFVEDKVEAAISIAKDLEKSVEETLKEVQKEVEDGVDLALNTVVYVYDKTIEITKNKLIEAKKGYENLLNYADSLVGKAKEEVLEKAAQVKAMIDKANLALAQIGEKIKQKGVIILELAKKKLDAAKVAYLNAVGNAKEALKKTYIEAYELYAKIRDSIVEKTGQVVEFVNDKIEQAQQMVEFAADAVESVARNVEDAMVKVGKISLGVAVIVGRKAYDTANDAINLAEEKLSAMANWVYQAGGVVKEALEKQIVALRAKLDEAKRKLSEVGKKVAEKVDAIEKRLDKGLDVAEKAGDATIKDLRAWADKVRKERLAMASAK